MERSRQVKWKRKMRSQGRCAQCGVPSATFRCFTCNEKHAAQKRAERARAKGQ